MKLTKQENKKNEHELTELLLLEKQEQQCGVKKEVFKINPVYGKGKLTSCSFNGLLIEHIDYLFNIKTVFKNIKNTNTLITSYLISGEKEIKYSNNSETCIQESYEAYISLMDNTTEEITYPKEKRINEVIIKISREFIQKHQLDTLFPIYNKFYGVKTPKKITNQLSYKTQGIITEIILDNRKGLLKRLFLESKVLELLSLHLDVTDTKEVNNNSTTKKVYLTKKIILENLDIQFSINELSKKIFLNEFLLKKEFKRIFGETIFEFALKERIKYAQKLLLYSPKPIYEIAELVGYKNPTHFSAAFKKRMNITPKQYRKRK